MKSFQSQTHYEVLEVSVGATIDEIKGAYARLAALYGDEQVALYGLVDPARAQMLRERLRQAVEVLTDDERRDAYDVSIGLPPRERPRVPAKPLPPTASSVVATSGWGQGISWVTATPSAPPAPSAAQVYSVAVTPPGVVVSAPRVAPSAPVAAPPPVARHPAEEPPAVAPRASPSPPIEAPRPTAPSEVVAAATTPVSGPPAGAAPHLSMPVVAAPAPPPAAPSEVAPASAAEVAFGAVVAPAEATPGPPPAAPSELAPASAAQVAAVEVVAPEVAAPAPPPAASSEPIPASAGVVSASELVAPAATAPAASGPAVTAPVVAAPAVVAASVAAPEAEASSPGLMAPERPGGAPTEFPGFAAAALSHVDETGAAPAAAQVVERTPAGGSTVAVPTAAEPGAVVPPSDASESAPSPAERGGSGEEGVPRLGDDVEVSIVAARATPSREYRAEPRPRPYEVPQGVEFNGDLLRQVRMARGLSLTQLSERTRISVRHLENVEGDRYQALPAPVYLRGILMNLARELGLDGLRVSKSYLAFVEAHRSKG